MFQNLGRKDFFQLVLLITTAVLLGYYYVNNKARNLLWYKTYPLRAELSNHQLSCSSGSPKWLSDIIRYQTKHGNAPANQIAYIDKNGQLHHCENGYIDETPIFSEPITKDTRFRYASVTKLWTSDTILDLIKADKLSFDTRLASILTEIKSPADSRINDITIGQLLLHRAGFDRYKSFGQDMLGLDEPICPNQLQRLNKISLGITPNEKMSYSNLGYCLLGEVIGRVNNRSYKQVINEKYHFQDTSLAFIENREMLDEVFYNHVETGLRGVGDIYTAFDYNTLASSIGLSGNAINLAEQIKLMANKPRPNIISVNKNLKCDLSKLRDCYGYAMFPYQADNAELLTFFRDGQFLGLSTLTVIDDRGRIVVVLSNGVSEDSDRLKLLVYKNLKTVE